MNWPNKLSITRILLVPIIITIELFPYHVFGLYFPLYTFNGITISLKNFIILGLFVIGSITDFLDGFIARRYNLVSSFGKFIDPIADKSLINTMLVILTYNRVIPLLPVIIMILRDIVVDGCRMVASGKGDVIAANIFGKLKTVSQIIVIIFALLNNYPFEIWGLQITNVFAWFSCFISVFSGVNYYNQIKDIIFKSF